VTPLLLFALYILALGAFLGLDIISRVPPTLYAVTLSGLGTLCAVVLVGVFGTAAGQSGALMTAVSAGMAGVTAGAGLEALGRLLQGRKKHGK
jgi:hypothetical protein